MGKALYTNKHNAIRADCPHRLGADTRWADELPPALKDLVVAPIRFDVFKEYELQAERTCGCDADNQPCYCAFQMVQTQLRSDDDEVFFAEPVYAESITSWRLLDERCWCATPLWRVWMMRLCSPVFRFVMPCRVELVANHLS